MPLTPSSAIPSSRARAPPREVVAWTPADTPSSGAVPAPSLRGRSTTSADPQIDAAVVPDGERDPVRAEDGPRAAAEMTLDQFLLGSDEEDLIAEALAMDEELIMAAQKLRRRQRRYTGSLDQFFLEIVRFRLLTPAQEKALGKRAQRGDEAAIALLVKHNLRFVVSVAKKYQNRGLPLQDLISEGTLGLMTAAKKFDPDKGVKYITYAVWWIRQSILAALAEQARAVRIPLNRSTDMALLLEAKVQLQNALQRSPSYEEMAKATGITVETVKHLLAVHEAPLRLDAPLNADSDQRLGERIPLTASTSPMALVALKQLKQDLEDALQFLPARDAKVLELYFGLRNTQSRTLEQIGEMLGITRERVRQLRDRAIKKLESGGKSDTLYAHYLEIGDERDDAPSFVVPPRSQGE